MARGDAGDSCAGSIGVRFDSNVVDEAEVDDVAGNFGVVTVAQSREDVGFSESRGWKCSLHWCDLGGWEGWYPPPVEKWGKYMKLRRLGRPPRYLTAREF